MRLTEAVVAVLERDDLDVASRTEAPGFEGVWLHGAESRTVAVLWVARLSQTRCTSSSAGTAWINQVERWFGLLTDQLIRRGVHKSVVALERDVREWIKTWNQDPKPSVWTKTAEDILQSLSKYIAKISDAGH